MSYFSLSHFVLMTCSHPELRKTSIPRNSVNKIPRKSSGPIYLWTIPEFKTPLTSVTFTLHRIFYCVAHTWVVIGCQRDLLLLGRILWMNLRSTRCKLRLSREALVKGLQNLIIVISESELYFSRELSRITHNHDDYNPIKMKLFMEIMILFKQQNCFLLKK